MKDKRVENIQIHKVGSDKMDEVADKVAVEEPLQIQLLYSTATGQDHIQMKISFR